MEATVEARTLGVSRLGVAVGILDHNGVNGENDKQLEPNLLQETNIGPHFLPHHLPGVPRVRITRVRESNIQRGPVVRACSTMRHSRISSSSHELMMYL